MCLFRTLSLGALIASVCVCSPGIWLTDACFWRLLSISLYLFAQFFTQCQPQPQCASWMMYDGSLGLAGRAARIESSANEELNEKNTECLSYEHQFGLILCRLQTICICFCSLRLKWRYSRMTEVYTHCVISNCSARAEFVHLFSLVTLSLSFIPSFQLSTPTSVVSAYLLAFAFFKMQRLYAV